MTELVADCPRCGAKRMTFDVREIHFTGRTAFDGHKSYEAFCVCRACAGSCIYLLSTRGPDQFIWNMTAFQTLDGTLNQVMSIQRHISIRDNVTNAPPEHLPEPIADIFNEAATCLAVECWNAAGTMFRLCVDLATKPLLPDTAEGQPEPNGLNPHVRRNLSPRLNWLFDNRLLPPDLRTLSTCIKDDGNDGAHDGTLEMDDAQDLLDFTTALLERLYTEPEKLRLAKVRREKRREKQAT